MNSINGKNGKLYVTHYNKILDFSKSITNINNIQFKLLTKPKRISNDIQIEENNRKSLITNKEVPNSTLKCLSISFSKISYLIGSKKDIIHSNQKFEEIYKNKLN
ncbi:hypothetical protein ABK040_003655 [Willaertia magna]